VLIYVNVTLLDDLPTAKTSMSEEKQSKAPKFQSTMMKGDVDLFKSSAIDVKYDP